MLIEFEIRNLKFEMGEFLMTRKTFLAAAVLLSLVVSPWLSLADEGMWLPDSLDRLPLAKLKGRGLQLTAEEIYSTTKPSLKDAVVFISVGGTGSFVSPEGLVLTNHHVAFGAVTAASTPQNVPSPTDSSPSRAPRRPGQGLQHERHARVQGRDGGGRRGGDAGDVGRRARPRDRGAVGGTRQAGRRRARAGGHPDAGRRDARRDELLPLPISSCATCAWSTSAEVDRLLRRRPG